MVFSMKSLIARCAILFALCYPHVARAQASGSEVESCKSENLGSAVGAEACFVYRLRAADAELVEVQADYESVVVAASSNPTTTKQAVESEANSWRTYRDAKCVLYGETEGGSEGWKNAMAASCEVQDSIERLALLRKRLAKK